MKSSHSPSPTTKENAPQPASADPLEERAAQIAKRNGNDRVTTKDQEAAFEEMRKTAPHQSSDETASH